MTRNRLHILVLVLTFLGFALVFFNVFQKEKTKTIPSLCALRTITGIPCPACGTTRSVAQIFTGHFRLALLINPLGYIASLLIIFSPLLVIADRVQKRNRFFDFYRKAEQLLRVKWITFFCIGLILLNWIWNIYKEL